MDRRSTLMSRFRLRWLTAMAVFVFGGQVGCNSDSAPSGNSDAGSAVSEKSTPGESSASTRERSGGSAVGASKGPSVFAGRIVFKGKVPAPRKITVTKDFDHCKAAGGEVQEVVVGADGGLADVVVEIMGVEAGDKPWEFDTPEGGYSLHQKGCSFSPRLTVMPDGSELKVFNDDPISHNVNTGQWNVLQPTGGDPIIKPIKGRSPIRIVCNIHSWMEAWVYPVRTPYYAVTKGDGSFRIEDIPSGDYRISVWNASLGRKRLREKLAGGATTNKEIVFESPEEQ